MFYNVIINHNFSEYHPLVIIAW